MFCPQRRRVGEHVSFAIIFPGGGEEEEGEEGGGEEEEISVEHVIFLSPFNSHFNNNVILSANLF